MAKVKDPRIKQFRDSDGDTSSVQTAESTLKESRKSVFEADELLIALSKRIAASQDAAKEQAAGSTLALDDLELQLLRRLHAMQTELADATAKLSKLNVTAIEQSTLTAQQLNQLKADLAAQALQITKISNETTEALLILTQKLNTHTHEERQSVQIALQELEYFVHHVKNSLLNNSTSELIPGVVAAAAIELAYHAKSITNIEAYDATTRVPIKLLDPASDFTHAAGTNVITCDTDQSAALLRVTYLRKSITAL